MEKKLFLIPQGGPSVFVFLVLYYISAVYVYVFW